MEYFLEIFARAMELLSSVSADRMEYFIKIFALGVFLLLAAVLLLSRFLERRSAGRSRLFGSRRSGVFTGVSRGRFFALACAGFLFSVLVMSLEAGYHLASSLRPDLFEKNLVAYFRSLLGGGDVFYFGLACVLFVVFLFLSYFFGGSLRVFRSSGFQAVSVVVYVFALLMVPAHFVYRHKLEREALASINSLGISYTSNDHVYGLRNAEPEEVLRLLAGELSVVEAEVWIPAVRSNDQAGRAAWCLRALRYLTGNKFKADTSFKFPVEDIRKNYLDEEGRLPFFMTSKDGKEVYIAPRDVQEAVIKRWRDWVEKNAGDFSFQEAPELQFWRD